MAPTVYPTGTTIYNPDKCWNGYTLFQSTLNQRPASYGAILMDMNGNVVNRWRGLDGFPNKLLPGGSVIGSTGVRNFKYGFQDMLDMVQVDWDGNVIWKFDRYERVKDGRQKARWILRQHHDYQREGNPVGYYVPGMDPKVDSGSTLILCHKNLHQPFAVRTHRRQEPFRGMSNEHNKATLAVERLRDLDSLGRRDPC